MAKKRRTIYVNVGESGRRVGQDHHNSTISDETVDLIRELHEKKKMPYPKIAELLNLSLHTVKDIGTYRTRAVSVTGTRRVTIYEEDNNSND